jgi:hypothetical protein
VSHFASHLLCAGDLWSPHVLMIKWGYSFVSVKRWWWLTVNVKLKPLHLLQGFSTHEEKSLELELGLLVVVRTGGWRDYRMAWGFIYIESIKLFHFTALLVSGDCNGRHTLFPCSNSTTAAPRLITIA